LADGGLGTYSLGTQLLNGDEEVLEQMKVLHLWKSDSPSHGGGGAGSMYRLHSNLRRAGIDSKILCEIKTTGSPHVTRIRLRSRWESRIRPITERLGLNDIHRVGSFRIKRHESYLEADIVNFHGIHSGFISYLALPSLTESKPAVFTVRDMWCLTGHCAFSYDCERWKIGCGDCPYPDAHPAIRRDATRIEWKLKNWVYGRSDLTLVALSKWLTEQVKASMLNRFPIYHISNGIDTKIYQPLDPDKCRYTLGIPPGKKVLMFMATALKRFQKGGDLLLEALHSLPESLKTEIVLLLLGKGGEEIAEASVIQALDLGYISNHRLKAVAYSAADLFVCPSRAESFGMVLLESMACGTPSVCFNVGPVPELVRPGITGYLAETENAKDFCNGIVQLLEDEPLRNYMGQKGREIALKEYPSELEAQRYIELYRQLL
jgi:glycosyltransferase involved in cell wall biosynthesis